MYLPSTPHIFNQDNPVGFYWMTYFSRNRSSPRILSNEIFNPGLSPHFCTFILSLEFQYLIPISPP